MEKNVIRIEAEPTREDANRIIAERREAVRAYVLEKLREFSICRNLFAICVLDCGLFGRKILMVRLSTRQTICTRQ